MIPNIHAIGDLQGCRGALDRLLDAIDASADDADDAGGMHGPLWFAGDLVNRGPDSLGTLRRVRALGERAVAVLGNHDLHLLAVAAGLRKPHRGDTFDTILAAPDADALVDWVRHRPLAHLAHGHLMVHAGVLPSWRPEDVVALAGEVEAALRGPGWRDFLAGMYGNRPAAWDPALEGADRLRVVVNALTRMRFATPDGTMEFETKDGAGAAPPGHLPWFDLPGRRTAGITVVCGHWSTLGLVSRPDLLALDTGCVWGGKLTAVRLGDRRVLQVDCSGAR